MGFLQQETTTLEIEKKTMQTHAEELIKILTHWEQKKPDKKKKAVVLNKSNPKLVKTNNKSF